MFAAQSNGLIRSLKNSKSVAKIRNLLPAKNNLIHSILLNNLTTSSSNVIEQARQLSLGKKNSSSSLSSSRGVIVKLLQNIGSKKEVEQYLKFYSEIEKPKFAVIKVGGAILTEELDVLADSLAFLAEVGLLPVVIHGAGPQLNEQLKQQNIVSDYINGMRITTPAILRTAKRVFHQENLKLITALESRGVRARPIVAGVFGAEYLDKEKFQLVGQINSVSCDQVFSALESGAIPVLTCMGETADGQWLNVNADVAAQELAKAMKPVKIVYLSSNGGINDEQDKLMPVIDLDSDYERLMNEPWFRHGNRLKLREIKTLLDSLPITSSVAITSAANLPKELFTHKGSGTLVKRNEKILVYDNMAQINREKLAQLIESSFGAQLNPDFLTKIHNNVHKIYLSENYNAVALITRESPSSVPYLDKFAVAKSSQSEGAGLALWNALRRDIPRLFWRSRRENLINSWYFERCGGSFATGEWQIFWYGLEHDWPTIQNCIEKAQTKEATIDRSKPINHSEHIRSFSTCSRPISTIGSGRRSFATLQRRFSSQSASRKRVGLIGARGYTGAELIKLIAAHPGLEISCVSSRALKNQPITAIVSDLPSSLSWNSLKISDLQPSELINQPVDCWVLALPNNLAAPYVAALQKGNFQGKIVDLSADFRFDSTWQYGLVERKGFRAAIQRSSLISNPGCYATGMQLALLPLFSQGIIDFQRYNPTVFGVSGYSGAGTTPSRKNNTSELADNLMPYTQQNHTHELEVNFQLRSWFNEGNKGKLVGNQGNNGFLRFMPHVAQFFRGIQLTIAAELRPGTVQSKENLLELYQEYYKGEKLVQVSGEIPEVAHAANKHTVQIGGFHYEKETGRLVMNATLDNLLKGAATQCLQNINLSLGYPELMGIIKQ
jgi:N-acetyl-gamma-glutamyl-phosphate reductase/acetylglutamate kinase